MGNDDDTTPDIPAITDFTVTNELPTGLVLSNDFGDAESLWNSRRWLEAALTAKGAKVTGAGMGMGQADIDILLEGYKFNVSIKPR